MAGFVISGVKKPLCSAARELIIKMDLREMGCEDGSWIELAQIHVEWQASVLAALKNLCVLLPEI